jgi:superfamily II DNA or RNA helicase
LKIWVAEVVAFYFNDFIKQHLIMLQSEDHKDEELMNLLRSKVKSSRDLVLIFVARKNTCDFVTNMLNRVGFRAAAMHSDRDQKHREATLADFKDGRIPIMVFILTVFIFTTILKILLKHCHYVSTYEETIFKTFFPPGCD